MLRQRLRSEVAPAPGKHAALVLTVGMSVEPVAATLRRLAGTLAGLSAAVWLLAALVGRWVARRRRLR